jgi:hypothetical protein
MPKHPAIAPMLKKELAAFFVATTDVKVVEDTAQTPAAILRRAGADPSLWWWAASLPDPARCWAACADDADRTVQVALSFGVPAERVARALAGALGMLASRLRTKYLPQRATLSTALTTFATSGTLDDPGVITKLAFEMRFKDQQATDPVAELSLHAHQLVETLAATKARPDVERFGALAGRADKMFASRGLQFAAMVRAELEDPIADAIAGGLRPEEEGRSAGIE